MGASSQVPVSAEQALMIRRATPADAEACGRICFSAFADISAQHNFPCDFPAPERAVGALSMMFAHSGFFCVIAEQNGRIIGSNCLDERASVAGIGPITVDPAAQNKSAGRQLMDAVMERGKEKKFAGIRLVQAGYHTRSLSLYAKLGFVVREPLACMQGLALQQAPPGYRVRTLLDADAAACNDLCMRVHGHDRAGELSDAISAGTAVLVEANGRIRAYATSLAFFGHAVGESNEDLQALIASAKEFPGPGILVPTRNAGLFRWCLDHGLRVVQPMTLMSIGLYNEPADAFLPSIMF